MVETNLPHVSWLMVWGYKLNTVVLGSVMGLDVMGKLNVPNCTTEKGQRAKGGPAYIHNTLELVGAIPTFLDGHSFFTSTKAKSISTGLDCFSLRTLGLPSG